MLKEISDLTQTSDDLKRRWFSDETLDMYVWYDNSNEISEFQISYNKQSDEQVLTWNNKSGLSHHGVDSGSTDPKKMKSSPILTEESRHNIELVRKLFMESGKKLEHDLYEYVFSPSKVCNLSKTLRRYYQPIVQSKILLQ